MPLSIYIIKNLYYSNRYLKIVVIIFSLNIENLGKKQSTPSLIPPGELGFLGSFALYIDPVDKIFQLYSSFQ